MSYYKEGLENVARYVGQKPANIELSYTFDRKRRLCMEYSRPPTEDWCAFMDGVPKGIANTDGRFRDFGNLIVQDLISVSDSTAYFFVTNLGGWASLNGVLKASPSQKDYVVFLFGSQSMPDAKRCNGEWNSNNVRVR